MTDESDLTIGIKKLRRRKRLPVFLFLILMPIMFILNFVENNYFAAKLVYYLFAISLVFLYFYFSLPSALAVRGTFKVFGVC